MDIQEYVCPSTQIQNACERNNTSLKQNLLLVTENALLATPTSRRESSRSPGSEKDGNIAKNEIYSTK